jgi:hypothetical protein
VAHHRRPPHGPGIDRGAGGRARRSQARRRGARIDVSAIQISTFDVEEQAWFTNPWLDGKNAVRLLETLGVLGGGNALPQTIQSALTLRSDEATSNDYARVDQTGVEATVLTGTDGVVWPAACSCLANWLARSHGGGHVPNVFLRSTTGWLLWRGLSADVARWEIGRARARDLSLSDGRTAEFTRLWWRRQYGAAWKLRLVSSV